MKKISISLTSLVLAGFLFSGCTDKKEIPNVTPTPPVADLNWQFESTPVWQDDFETGSVPDNSKWSYDVGGDGWGNNESQYYTNGNNASIVNGKLVITAKRENISGRNYSSARLISRGKGDFQYGRFVVRAKLPAGRGTWPAIWMLPTDNQYGIWPSSGEIDIMEHVGYDANNVHCSVHTSAYNYSRGNQKTNAVIVPNATSEFHDYRVDWTPYAVRGYVDDVQYFEFTNENAGFTKWPFDKKFYLIMNTAVGGNWGGAQGIDDAAFPTTMEVDYVKVFKMIP